MPVCCAVRVAMSTTSRYRACCTQRFCAARRPTQRCVRSTQARCRTMSNLCSGPTRSRRARARSRSCGSSVTRRCCTRRSSTRTCGSSANRSAWLSRRRAIWPKTRQKPCRSTSTRCRRSQTSSRRWHPVLRCCTPSAAATCSSTSSPVIRRCTSTRSSRPHPAHCAPACTSAVSPACRSRPAASWWFPSPTGELWCTPRPNRRMRCATASSRSPDYRSTACG